MRLNLHEVSRLSRELVGVRYAGRVVVDGVARVKGDSDYAEVLLTVKPAGGADRRGPRTILVQARRRDAATLESDLLRRLARALRGRPSQA
jgi:hypothetical protein